MRLFFALWPPESVAETLAAEAHALAHRFGGKATRRETIHLTLAFLGEVDDARLPQVIEAARGVRAGPFELRIDRLGYWRHNRLIWAGCSAEAPPLRELADALRERLRAAGTPGDEAQGFVPHLTLVRNARVAAPAELPALEPLAWRCEGFVLVRSRRTEAGAGYLAVAEFPGGDG